MTTSNVGRMRVLGNRVNPTEFTMVDNNNMFDQSQTFDASYISDTRRRMRSSRQKKRGKMIVSMAKSSPNRSKSRSLSKTKNREKFIGSTYKPVDMAKSKSRSVPKQRHTNSVPFNTNVRMDTIDEPAARIFNQKDNRSLHSPKMQSKGPKIIKLKKKQKRTVIRQSM